MVPPEFAGPSPANHAGPLRKMVGTDAKLRVLLMGVGAPYSPKFAGEGGLKRVLPVLPSSESRSAVSSPHMSAPAARKVYRPKSLPEPCTFLPRRAAPYASVSAAS